MRFSINNSELNDRHRTVHLTRRVFVFVYSGQSVGCYPDNRGEIRGIECHTRQLENSDSTVLFSSLLRLAVGSTQCMGKQLDDIRQRNAERIEEGNVTLHYINCHFHSVYSVNRSTNAITYAIPDRFTVVTPRKNAGRLVSVTIGELEANAREKSFSRNKVRSTGQRISRYLHCLMNHGNHDSVPDSCHVKNRIVIHSASSLPRCVAV